MTRQTSIDAYNTIKNNGLLSHLRWLVYDYLFTNGPSTAKEMHMALKKEGSNDGCFTTRLSELRRMGLVIELGTVKCKYTNRNVILWDVTSNLPNKLTPPITTKKQLLRAENFIKESGMWEAYLTLKENK